MRIAVYNDATNTIMQDVVFVIWKTACEQLGMSIAGSFLH